MDIISTMRLESFRVKRTCAVIHDSAQLCMQSWIKIDADIFTANVIDKTK